MRRIIIAAALVVACGPPDEPDGPRGLLGGGPLSGQGGIASVTTSSPLSGTGSSGSAVTVASGTRLGDVLVWDGSSWTQDSASRTRRRYRFVEEFDQAACAAATPSPKFSGAATNTTVACNAAVNYGVHPGIFSQTLGTAASDGYRMLTNPTVVFGNPAGGGGAGGVARCVNVGYRVQNIPTSTTWYFMQVGYSEPSSNSPTTASVDAVEAQFRPSVNGAFWALKTSQAVGAGGGSTVTVCNGSGGTLSEPVTANTTYDLELCVDALATSATLTVNHNPLGACATNTTNIPTGQTRATGFGYQIFQDGGSVPATQLGQLDYFEEDFPFGQAR